MRYPAATRVGLAIRVPHRVERDANENGRLVIP
jgi:hypothetical protein